MNPQDSATGTAASPRERRAQSRHRIQTPVQLILPDLATPVIATAWDISWGGVRLVLPEALPPATDRCQLLLPWTRDNTLRVVTRRLRVQARGAWQQEMAVQFIRLSRRAQSRLARLLKLLGQHPGGEGHALPRRLTVTINDPAELNQRLSEIATGYCTLVLPDACLLHQAIRFSLITTHLPAIRLNARVVAVQAPGVPGRDGITRHRLILELAHPRPWLQDFVASRMEALLRAQCLGLGGPASRVSTGADNAGGQRDAKCPLEIGFPEIVARLTACWGDTVAFNRLFRDVVLGDVGQPGGWSTDLWADLTLLQDVHVLAYRPPPSRDTGGASQTQAPGSPWTL